MHDLTLEHLAPSALKPHPRNPRVHPESALDKLSKSIHEFGWTNPILAVKENGHALIVAGHARLKAAQRMNLSTVPVIFLPLKGPQIDAYLIADNRMQEHTTWDLGVLRGLLGDLDTGAFDMTLTGFDLPEIEKLLVDDLASEDNLMGVTADIGGAFALKKEMFFDSTEPFGIPPLRMDRLTECPENIECWAGHDATPKGYEWHLYNYGSDSIKGLNLRKTVLSFYVDDYRFEQAWDKPDEFAGKILNRGIPIVVAPNYSVRADDPEALQIWNTYRSRWVARYFQEAGFQVIPDVLSLHPKTHHFAFAGIPKGAPCIARHLHQKADEEWKRIQIEGLRKMVEVLEPQSVLLYVGRFAEEYVEKGLPKDMKVITVTSRVHLRGPVMRKAKTGKEE